MRSLESKGELGLYYICDSISIQNDVAVVILIRSHDVIELPNHRYYIIRSVRRKSGSALSNSPNIGLVVLWTLVRVLSNSVGFQPMGSYIGNEARYNPILYSHLGSEFPGEKDKGVRMSFNEA